MPQQLDSVLIGYASAYDMRDRSDQRARTLRALGHIYRQRMDIDADRKTVAEAAKEIRSVLDLERGFDPETFAGLAKALYPSADDVALGTTMLKVPVAMTIAGLSPLLGAPLGITAALAGLGVIADGAISQFGSEALRNILPRASDEQVVGITAWAVKKMADLAAADPKILELALDLNKTGYLDINLSQPGGQSLGKLPSSLRNIVKPHVAIGPDTAVPKAVETQAAVRDELKTVVERLQLETDKFIDVARRERNKAIRAIREAEAQRQVQYIAQELIGAGVVGNVLLSSFGPDLAGIGAKLQGFAQTGASIFVALSTPGLGPFALAGVLSNSATTLLNLFGDQPDPLLTALQPLSAKLDRVIERLDVIAEQQARILDMLKRIYSGIAANRDLLIEVNAQLSKLGRGNIESAIALDRGAFDYSRDRLGILLKNHSPDAIKSDNELMERYTDGISASYSYATSTARSVNSTAYSTLPNAESQWRNEIRDRGRCDRLVGLLPNLARTLGVPLPPLSAQRAGGPVNPTTWAEGIRVFLEGRTRGADVPLIDASQVQELWRDGVYIRELILRMTSPEAIGAAGRRFRDAMGAPPDGQSMNQSKLAGSNNVLGVIYRTAMEYLDRVVPLSTGSPVEVGNQGKYYSKWDPVYTVNYPTDIFWMLFDHQLAITESPTPSPGLNPGHVDVFIRITAAGPWYNQLLVPDKVGMGQVPIRYPANLFNQPANPNALQDAAKPIVLGLMYRKLIHDIMPEEIRGNLNGRADTSYDYWGEILRFLGALVRWRFSTESDTLEDLLVVNSWGPYTPNELHGPFTMILKERLSLSGGESWAFEAAQLADTCVNESIESLRAQAATLPSGKCVPVIDETLRHLAGYMIARGIDIPEIPEM